MALLGDRPPRQTATSLIAFAWLFLLLTCVVFAPGSAGNDDPIHFWINGTAALWGPFRGIDIRENIIKDAGYPTSEIDLIQDIFLHTASRQFYSDSYPLKSDGIGLDVYLDRDTLFEFDKKFVDKLVGSKLPHLNALVGTTFGHPIRAFSTLPTTELFINNDTLAISHPIKLWELYLSISKPLIPQDRVFQVPDEVLKYMPIDLQDALGADQSHYQIMPTSMWTNSTDVYINYTVYAAPIGKIPAELRLTPVQVRDRLLGRTLPRFGSELANTIESNEKFSELRGLLWLPVFLRKHLPPNPNPNPPTPFQVVSTVTARFMVRFSGKESGWKSVVANNFIALEDGIKTSVEATLGRHLYVTEVNVTRLLPVKDTARRIECLLVYGEVKQGRTVMAQHPWDARDIISVLSQGDYSAALALYPAGEAPAELITVSLDADFGSDSTVHQLVLICSVVVTAGLTVITILLYFVIGHFSMQSDAKADGWDGAWDGGEWYKSDQGESDLSCNEFSFEDIEETRLPQPEAFDEQRLPGRIDNPLETMIDTTAEESLETVCSF